MRSFKGFLLFSVGYILIYSDGTPDFLLQNCTYKVIKKIY